jgi:hypothetical protein
MLGASTREVAPDAVLAVHSPRVVVHFRDAATPTQQMRTAATERGLDRADRMLQSYIAKMGADIGLLDLARTVETPRIFEGGNRGLVRKIVTQRGEGDKAYHMSQWRLFCFNTEQFELDYQRPAATSSMFPTILISNSGSVSMFFRSAPVRTPEFEI